MTLSIYSDGGQIQSSPSPYGGTWREMPCLEWDGYRDEDGYGIFTEYRRTGTRLVHRRTWIECFGPLERNDVIAHHCDNPPCRQPLHLFKTDRKGNNEDMAAKGRHFAQLKTHCPRGHPLSGDNLIPRKLKIGKRSCRTCEIQKKRDARRHLKEGRCRAS